MMSFRVAVHVVPRRGILDPQGKAVTEALHSLGFSAVAEVHVGRHLVIQTTATDAAAAEADAGAAPVTLSDGTVISLEDLGRRTLCQHPPIADDAGMVANAQGLTHVVVGDQHPQAARLEKTDDALDLDHRDRIDTGKRLIEQNEAGLGRQGPGDFDTASLSTGQRGGR